MSVDTLLASVAINNQAIAELQKSDEEYEGDWEGYTKDVWKLSMASVIASGFLGNPDWTLLQKSLKHFDDIKQSIWSSDFLIPCLDEAWTYVLNPMAEALLAGDELDAKELTKLWDITANPELYSINNIDDEECSNAVLAASAMLDADYDRVLSLAFEPVGRLCTKTLVDMLAKSGWLTKWMSGQLSETQIGQQEALCLKAAYEKQWQLSEVEGRGIVLSALAWGSNLAEGRTIGKAMTGANYDIYPGEVWLELAGSTQADRYSYFINKLMKPVSGG